MAESISPERMQRLMELSNNAMTVELGALRNPQVTTVPSNEANAFYQSAPYAEREINKYLYEQYRKIREAKDKFARGDLSKYRFEEAIRKAKYNINQMKPSVENGLDQAGLDYLDQKQQEGISSLKDTVSTEFNPDFSMPELDQSRDQIVLGEKMNESVLAHEIGHAAFSVAKDFFRSKVVELGSIEDALKATALEYGENIADKIEAGVRGNLDGLFADTDEATVQYYDNPLGDDPSNPGGGTPTSEGGPTYYSPEGGFDADTDNTFSFLPSDRANTTDPLLQKPFTDYRTGELVYHDEYKGDFEGDLKEAGLMGFETLMSDLISERKGLDRFAERQRRGLKINPLGAPPSVAHETIRDEYGKILFNEGAETGGTQVLRSVRPQTRPENFAQGGPVMRGIGTLNETAKNMFRGPRGIGAYQQFAGGGEANRELEDFFNEKSKKEIPPARGLPPPPARGLPPMDSPFGDGIRNFEDTFSKPQGRGRGYFDDVNFRIDSYEIDGKPSYAIEFDDGFSLFEPQIIEMMDENNSANEPIPGERTRKELFRYLFENNPTSDEFFRYLKTTGLASGGEVSGPPPTRGPDPQGIGYFQQFADGGPVYMQEGGDPTMRQKLLSVIYDVESDGDYDQWNYAAKNIPETPITDMTVEQIMRYQGDENGPAAGAGQIKFNTFKTLLKMDDGLLPTDVFTPEVQDHANNRLLDRRGFNAWSRGEKSSFDFANDLASEWAGLPLVRDTIKTTGEVRKAGESRYGNNTPGISANNWLSAVTSAFGDEVPDQIGPSAPVYKSTPVFPNSSEGDLDLAMYAEDYGMPTPTGFTPTLRPQLRPQGIMSIQDPAVMDRVVEQVQEELPPTQEERDLFEKYSPENMFPDAGLTEGEMIRRERFAPKDGDAEPYRQPLNLTTP